MIGIWKAALAGIFFCALGCGASASQGSAAGPSSNSTTGTDGASEPQGTSDATKTAEDQPGGSSPGKGGDRGGISGANPRGPKEAEEAGNPDSAQPAPPAQAVVTSTTALSGRLTQQDIANVLSQNAAYFNDCYTIGAGNSQAFIGTVTVKATLGPSGAVTEAKVIKSTAKNPKVDQCVVDAFKKIKFPAPKDGGTSVITFPMEFQGVEQVR